MSIIEITNSILALMAVLAGGISWFEYLSHKKKEENKLFSQLNKRYERNDDIQTVIKYLRSQEPSDKAPNLYQLEIFLRFFEELGLYIMDGSINVKKVEIFFKFYLQQLYTTEKGKSLLQRLGLEEEKNLELLQDVKYALNIK